ncbi:MAG: hypothetical protein HIU88_13420 [Acidobacteria bacterium]|nr:hypothetical protein [Acidobacteriota bacterium]
MTTSDASSRDGSTLLSFAGWPGWTLLASFVVVFAVIAALAGGPAMRDGHAIVTLVLLTAAAALSVLPGRDPLDLWRVLVIIGLIVTGTFLMLEQLLLGGPSGFLHWHSNASNFILFAVALRGRIGWAWIGLATVCGITLTWSLLATHALWRGLNLSYGEVGSLLAGTFFAVVMRTAANRVMALQAVRRLRIGEEHLRAEGERERAVQLALVRQRVIPVLTTIASGQVSSEQRQEHRLLEAVLRDEIRGARLAVEPLASAVRAARSRGIDVVLLDDADDVTLAWGDLEWAADAVAEIDRDRVTVRLSGDPAVLTVATVNGDIVNRPIHARPPS